MYGPLFIESDPFSPVGYVYRVKSVLHSSRSAYQQIDVLDTVHFGRVLVLDGVVQLTEKDEFFYHEMLAHVALHAHPHPARVAIIGGGDGGTLREVLKHESVREVHLIEIDEQVIEVSTRFFPGLAAGFSDPRVHVHKMDASDFVRQPGRAFDIVIVDCTDPVGVAEPLFDDGFFGAVSSLLHGEGIYVAQTESLHFHRDFVADVQRRLSGVFATVDLYTTPLATYAGNWWTFSVASDACTPREPVRRCEVATRYYDEQVHRAAFLPRSLYGKLVDNKLDW